MHKKPVPTYTAAELALFKAYRAKREKHRPRKCSQGKCCWVVLGPPGYSYGASGVCIECTGVPR